MTDKDKLIRDAGTILSIIKYLLVLFLGLSLIIFGLKIVVYFVPLFVGLILAQAAISISNRIKQLTKNILPARPSEPPAIKASKRSKALTVAVYFTIVLGFVFFIVLLVGFGVRQMQTLLNRLPSILRSEDFIERILELLRNFSEHFGNLLSDSMLANIAETLHDAQNELLIRIPSFLQAVLTTITSFAGDLPRIILVIMITIMAGYYAITDIPNLLRAALRFIPSSDFVRKVANLLGSLSSTIFRIGGGYVVLLFITFFEVFIGFKILDLPYALVLSVVTAIVDFLPILGTAAVLIPMTVYAFIAGDTLVGVGLIILLIIITVARRF